LNISDDHIDRHYSLDQYAQIKMSIYKNAKHKICLRGDTYSADLLATTKATSFGLDQPDANNFGVKEDSSGRWLMHGKEKILRSEELPILGTAGELNVLVALALTNKYIHDQAAALSVIRIFKGLPHRCELVVEHNQVQWINDSKGTNAGATVSAIVGLNRPLILILGGIHKGGSIDLLMQAVREKVRLVIVFGRDKELFVSALHSVTNVIVVDSLSEAVQQAANNVNMGEAVLFSPACSSFDMFTDYQERGRAFHNAVIDITKGKEHAC